LCEKDAVGRIVARPFIGTNESYIKMANRRDYSLTPFEVTILDKIKKILSATLLQ
jgi:phosphopentomutase